MGVTPRETDITLEFDCQFRVRLKDCRLTTLLGGFCTLLPKILTDFLQKALVGYGELVMARSVKPFRCGTCGNDRAFLWKTRHGKETKILTTFQWVVLRQLQVQCKRCRHKLYITRSLLGLEAGTRIPKEVFRKLGLIGSLATYRVAAKIVSTFGWTLDKMTIWKAVQKTAKEIAFALDPKEEARGEADGTGIGINGIKKRGQELKVFIQYKKGGGVRVAGVDIGPYNGSWHRLFEPSLKAFRSFRNFLLVTDGDTSILSGLRDKVTVLFQRCLWHIPYQLKYALWQDRKHVKRKSPEWLHVMGEVMEICAIRSGVEEAEVVREMIASKAKRLEAVIAFCQEKGCTATVAYLQNARGDLFTALSNRLQGKTTSRVERLFRTVNMRINVGKWSTAGGLNVTKVRLAYYYNGFDA